MNPLVQSIIQPFINEEILPQNKPTLAVYPGKFKPPHAGHAMVAKKLMDVADKVVILISPKMHEGITPHQSEAIWNLYNEKLFNNKLTIQISDKPSPVTGILNEIKNHQDMEFIAACGKGEEDRFVKIGRDPEYMNARTFDAGILEGGISATELRASINNNQDISRFLPKGIYPQEYLDILTPEIPLNESSPVDEQRQLLLGYIQSLNEYMIKQGMNVQPLPRVEIIDNDVANAANFFGKTAYYNPGNITITLFTLNRHPKDVIRSYAHETIHHIQNLEDRLPSISTTNTNEDGKLEEIEREAYELGNITFRNWTDSQTNPTTQLNEGTFDSYILDISRQIINAFKRKKTLNLTYTITRGGEEAEFDLVARFVPVPDLSQPYSISANSDMNSFNMSIEFNPTTFPQAFSDMVAEVKETVTHELEHIGQQNFEDMNVKYSNYETTIEYYTSPQEIPAFIKGLIKRAKTKHIPLATAMEEWHQENILNFSNPETDWPIVKRIWLDWIKDNKQQLKKFI